MRDPRSPRPYRAMLALVLSALAVLGLAPALAQPGPQQSFFGYSRIALPLISKPAPQPIPPVAQPQPRIVAWLDIPGQVRINDRLQVIVNIENQGSADFTGRTDVIIPYEGRRFEAVDSSFDRSRGDWVRQNRFPTDLTVEFGALRSREHRRGVIYFQLRETQIGDRLRIRGRFTNGQPACGQDVCPTNERRVEVVDRSVSGGVGTLPPGSRVVQRLGDIRYGEQRNWTPEGFRPGEQVVTWLNSASGGQQPLTLQQKADRDGRVSFNINLANLRNGFYSIVAHGIDTRTEIVGEFQVLGSPVAGIAAGGLPVLTALPIPTAPFPDLTTPQSVAAPAQSQGVTTLTGVVAAAGTAGSTRLAGVQVNVIAADGTTVGAVATDRFGGYVIGGLGAGSYTVSFDPHFSLDAATRRYQPRSQAAVTLPATGLVRQDAELDPGASISGLVNGASAGGLEGVSVLLLSGEAVVEATTTGADGRYTLDGVPSGSYTLLFDPATSVNAGVRAFDRANLPAFTVAAPAPLSGKNITLGRSADTVEVAGQVVSADNSSPLIEVYVVFERLNPTSGSYEYAGLALTDAAGAYSGVLPPGRYRVAFNPQFSPDPASALYLGEYFDNIGGDPAGATTLDLAGGASARADAALAPGATIAGTVVGADGPLADVAVLAYDIATGALADVELTGEDGTYRTAGLPTGSYRIEYATYLTDNATTQGYAGKTRTEAVALGAGARVDGIDATLSLGGRIAGLVTGAAEAPLANVLVLVIDTRGTPAPDDDLLSSLALTGVDGTYTSAGLPAGSYVVAFITELTGGPDTLAYFDEYYNDATILAEADLVAVTAGATTTRIDAILTQGGQIRGRVSDADEGFGLAGVLVEVYPADAPTTLVAFAITDERGDYATTALEPGQSYLVRFDPVFGGGLALYAPEYYDNAATVAAAQPVSVPAVTPVTGIDASLAPAP